MKITKKNLIFCLIVFLFFSITALFLISSIPVARANSNSLVKFTPTCNLGNLPSYDGVKNYYIKYNANETLERENEKGFYEWSESPDFFSTDTYRKRKQDFPTFLESLGAQATDPIVIHFVDNKNSDTAIPIYFPLPVTEKYYYTGHIENKLGDSNANSDLEPPMTREIEEQTEGQPKKDDPIFNITNEIERLNAVDLIVDGKGAVCNIKYDTPVTNNATEAQTPVNGVEEQTPEPRQIQNAELIRKPYKILLSGKIKLNINTTNPICLDMLEDGSRIQIYWNDALNDNNLILTKCLNTELQYITLTNEGYRLKFISQSSDERNGVSSGQAVPEIIPPTPARLTTGQIAGIAVGSVAGAGIIVTSGLAIDWFGIKKKSFGDLKNLKELYRNTKNSKEYNALKRAKGIRKIMKKEKKKEEKRKQTEYEKLRQANMKKHNKNMF